MPTQFLHISAKVLLGIWSLGFFLFGADALIPDLSNLGQQV
jgi:hypothetical protein